jgi:hypothetical protein
MIIRSVIHRRAGSVSILPAQSANWLHSPAFARHFSLICLAFYFLVPVCFGAESSTADLDPRWMMERYLEQGAAAKLSGVFTGFRFTDKSPASGIQFEDLRVDDSLKHFKPSHYDHGCGVAVADVDGDGKLDIYFVTALGTNALYRNLGGGKFEDITAAAGVGLPNQISVSCSFADIDNDGDPDLFVTTTRFGNHLFENLGGGKFRDVTEKAGVAYMGHSSSVTFFDFDNDGLLDIFLCNTGKFTTDEKGPGGFYRSVKDAFKGHLYPERTEYSLLYKNEGNLKFREVSRDLGLVSGSWSGEAAIVDFNGDHYPDLYIVNMQGDNHYFENQQGKGFKDKTSLLFPKTPWGAMGVVSFDYNLDGLLDLFVTDMHSDMTTLQTKVGQRNLGTSFVKQKSDAWCSQEYTEAVLQGSSNNIFGNAFYENKGNGKFEEVSDKIGVETYWPWGPSVADLNADGYEDIFVTAGMGYPYRYGANSLLINDAGRRFFDAEFLLHVEPRRGNYKLAFTLNCDGEDRDDPRCQGKSGNVEIFGALASRSSVIFDLDDDGDLDIVTSENSYHPQVLISNLAETKTIHFLKLKLVGTTSNRDALGALVRVHAGGKIQTRLNHGKSGYLSQSSMPLYFGLGAATEVEQIEITWPSGKKDTISPPIALNGLLTIRESR